MIINTDEIEEFINRRFKQDCDWLTGNCYYFAAILKIRFPYLEIVYFPVAGHFATLYRRINYFYDYRGKYQTKEVFYFWNELRNVEPNLFERIVKDCVE